MNGAPREEYLPSQDCKHYELAVSSKDQRIWFHFYKTQDSILGFEIGNCFSKGLSAFSAPKGLRESGVLFLKSDSKVVREFRSQPGICHFGNDASFCPFSKHIKKYTLLMTHICRCSWTTSLKIKMLQASTCLVVGISYGLYHTERKKLDGEQCEDVRKRSACQMSASRKTLNGQHLRILEQTIPTNKGSLEISSWSGVQEDGNHIR